jgi:hypothetical protein
MAPGLDGAIASRSCSSPISHWRETVSTPSTPARAAALPVRPTVWRRRRSVGAAIGAVVLAVALLSGCTGKPGAAAMVDGRTISVADVQQGTSDLAPYFKSVDQKSVLMLLMGAPTVQAVAEQAGLGVSDQQALDLLVASAKSNGSTATPKVGRAAIEVIRFSLAQKALEAAPNAADLVKKVNDQLTALHVAVNPRYGKVDLSTGSFTDIVYPWLVPSASAAAAPTDTSTATPTDAPTTK